MIKYVNMQTSLCPICKKNNILRQSNTQHLNQTHRANLEETDEIIRNVKQLAKKAKEDSSNKKDGGSKRKAFMEIAESYIQINIEKLKQVLLS